MWDFVWRVNSWQHSPIHWEMGLAFFFFVVFFFFFDLRLHYSASKVRSTNKLA